MKKNPSRIPSRYGDSSTPPGDARQVTARPAPDRTGGMTDNPPPDPDRRRCCQTHCRRMRFCWRHWRSRHPATAGSHHCPPVWRAVSPCAAPTAAAAQKLEGNVRLWHWGCSLLRTSAIRRVPPLTALTQIFVHHPGPMPPFGFISCRSNVPGRGSGARGHRRHRVGPRRDRGASSA